MRALLPIVLGAALLAGCSGATVPTGDAPGIAARSDVVVEERSTCEALARVDLGRVAGDAASRARSEQALREALERAPVDLRQRAGDEAAVIAWFNARCGGSR